VPLPGLITLKRTESFLQLGRKLAEGEVAQLGGRQLDGQR
jgi:hypothetical protein